MQRLSHAAQDDADRSSTRYGPHAFGSPGGNENAAAAGDGQWSLVVGWCGNQHRFLWAVGSFIRDEPDPGPECRARYLDRGYVHESPPNRQTYGNITTDPAADAVASILKHDG